MLLKSKVSLGSWCNGQSVACILHIMVLRLQLSKPVSPHIGIGCVHIDHSSWHWNVSLLALKPTQHSLWLRLIMHLGFLLIIATNNCSLSQIWCKLLPWSLFFFLCSWGTHQNKSISSSWHENWEVIKLVSSYDLILHIVVIYAQKLHSYHATSHLCL